MSEVAFIRLGLGQRFYLDCVSVEKADAAVQFPRVAVSVFPVWVWLVVNVLGREARPGCQGKHDNSLPRLRTDVGMQADHIDVEDILDHGVQEWPAALD